MTQILSINQPAVPGNLQGIIVRQNDTRPFLDFILVNSSNVAHNLTGATIVFSMTNRIGGTNKIDEQSMSIVTALEGKIRYTLQVADTNKLGQFLGEVEVTFSDGGILTFPKNGYIIINIVQEIS